MMTWKLKAAFGHLFLFISLEQNKVGGRGVNIIETNNIAISYQI